MIANLFSQTTSPQPVSSMTEPGQKERRVRISAEVLLTFLGAGLGLLFILLFGAASVLAKVGLLLLGVAVIYVGQAWLSAGKPVRTNWSLVLVGQGLGVVGLLLILFTMIG